MSAVIHVKLPRRYPFQVPYLKAEKSKGLTRGQLAALQDIIDKEANCNVGNQMIYAIISAAQAYLQLHNVRPISIHDEMKQRTLEKELKDTEIKKATAIAMEREENLIQEKLEAMISHELEKQQNVVAKKETKKIADNVISSSRDGSDDEDTTNDLVLQRLLSDVSYAPTRKNNSSSRYENDFDEIEVLGVGGFGEVVKTRNKLDALLYAVKIVEMKHNRHKLNREIIKEVVTLARLNHHNIVRYYNVYLLIIYFIIELGLD